MKLTVLGTGSSGNCYVLEAGGADGQLLLLDAGIPVKQIMRGVKGWSRIEGCLITHEHGDHAKAAEEIAALGIPTYATAGTIKGIVGSGSLTRLNTSLALRAEQVGQFTIMPFETQHDANEPCGWLIRYNPTQETVIYATDTYYLKQTFPGVNYWIVECNYVESIMNEQQESGELTPELRNRLIKSHMSLRRLCDALEANDLHATRAIVLVHLSDERSDEKLMVDTVKQATGIDDVWAAEAGKTYELELVPF